MFEKEKYTPSFKKYTVAAQYTGKLHAPLNLRKEKKKSDE